MKKAIVHISEDDKRVKGSNRIQINNNLTAVSLVILSLLLTTNKLTVGVLAVSQLAIAIPCLATSSLAYAKLCYRIDKESILWNWLGWFAHSIGYIAILNSFTLILSRSNYPSIAWLFLGAIAVLHILYSVINIISKNGRWKLGTSKLLFYFILLAFGSVLPVLNGW